MMQNALTLAVELAEPGPARTPNMTIALDKEALQSYTVIWSLSPPFINRYSYKYGPAQTTDCLAPSGYDPFPVSSAKPKQPLKKGESAKPKPSKLAQIFHSTPYPVKVCTYAFDQANQRSTLRVDLLKPR